MMPEQSPNSSKLRQNLVSVSLLVGGDVMPRLDALGPEQNFCYIYYSFVIFVYVRIFSCTFVILQSKKKNSLSNAYTKPPALTFRILARLFMAWS